MRFAFRWIPLLALFVCISSYGPEPDHEWTANTALHGVQVIADPEVGRAQGATLLNGFLYVYGDVTKADPRVGVIKEYDLSLKPTGRIVRLTRGGKPLLIHPTGLTQDKRWGTFLGDTVKGVSTIYHLDWEQAWKDGNLDNAVKDVITDDAAVNGGRPIFVEVGGKTLLATADYGDKTPQLRIYDPEKLLAAKRSTAPGVMLHQIPVGPFNQNLAWDPKTKRLMFVQNVTAGRGWQLDVVNLSAALAAKNLDAPGVRVEKKVYLRHDELEGYVKHPDGRDILIMGGLDHSIIAGNSQSIPPQTSPVGDTRFSLAADERVSFVVAPACTLPFSKLPPAPK